MRARINERLAQASRYALTLLVAPAGFGKSVALRDFIDTARLDVLRYDVRREDSTLLAFARRLSETLEPIAPSAIAAFGALQQRVLGSDEPARLVADWFAEHLRRTVCTIAIDDLHYASGDPATIELLLDLIERSSERIRWIIATRSDAGLPVASWMAYGRMDLPIGEDDLRFTPAEALAAAEAVQSEIAAGEVEILRELTGGWAVALAIALRTRTHVGDLRAAASGTREMVYRYLAEQVFNALDGVQRDFLLASCVFSTFDAAGAQALGASPEFLSRLRRGVTFLGEPAPGEYRYHDLFRDFLESELHRRGEDAWDRALHAGARLLEERSELVQALRLYAKAREADAILRIVEAHGFSLFERGEAETLALALEAVPDELRRGNATALGIRAMLDASRGHFEVAQPQFAAAIELAAERRQQIALVHRYAIELVRHERDSIPLLGPYAVDSSIEPPLRVPLMGTLATAFVRAGRIDDALAMIERALKLLERCDDDIRARVWQQAAFIYQYSPDRKRARTFANLAVDLALRRNLYEVAARAYSVLYVLTYDENDDPIACLAILDKLLECARKGASEQARLFGLVGSYGLEVERGADAALADLEAELADAPAIPALTRAEALLPAQALRAAWSGDFAQAHEILKDSAQLQTSDERRALRAAQIALYALAAGRGAEGERSLAEASLALTHVTEASTRALRTRLFLALAEMSRGHLASAHHYLKEVERAPSRFRRLRALAAAVRTHYRVALGQAEERMLASAIERLRAEHFGGMARLLEALPRERQSEGSFATLTGAEREILQALARGASTKEIAQASGRSPRTVDTHIRSLCQKLKCDGRRQAVALATGEGWVQP